MDMINMFNKIDSDHSGEITHDELVKFMKANNYTEEFVDKWLDLFDLNNRGRITMEDFCERLGLEIDENMYARFKKSRPSVLNLDSLDNRVKLKDTKDFDEFVDIDSNLDQQIVHVSVDKPLATPTNRNKIRSSNSNKSSSPRSIEVRDVSSIEDSSETVKKTIFSRLFSSEKHYPKNRKKPVSPKTPSIDENVFEEKIKEMRINVQTSAAPLQFRGQVFVEDDDVFVDDSAIKKKDNLKNVTKAVSYDEHRRTAPLTNPISVHDKTPPKESLLVEGNVDQVIKGGKNIQMFAKFKSEPLKEESLKDKAPNISEKISELLHLKSKGGNNEKDQLEKQNIGVSDKISLDYSGEAEKDQTRSQVKEHILKGNDSKTLKFTENNPNELHNLNENSIGKRNSKNDKVDDKIPSGDLKYGDDESVHLFAPFKVSSSKEPISKDDDSNNSGKYPTIISELQKPCLQGKKEFGGQDEGTPLKTVDDKDQKLKGDLKHLSNLDNKNWGGQNIKDPEELSKDDSKNVERDLVKKSEDDQQMSEGKRIKDEIKISEKLKMDVMNTLYEKDASKNNIYDKNILSGDTEYKQDGGFLLFAPFKALPQNEPNRKYDNNDSRKDSASNDYVNIERDLTKRQNVSKEMSGGKLIQNDFDPKIKIDEENIILEPFKMNVKKTLLEKGNSKNDDVDDKAQPGDLKYRDDKSVHLFAPFKVSSSKEQNQSDGINNDSNYSRKKPASDEFENIESGAFKMSEGKQISDENKILEQLKKKFQTTAIEKDALKNNVVDNKVLLGDLKYGNEKSVHMFAPFTETSPKKEIPKDADNENLNISRKYPSNNPELQKPQLQEKKDLLGSDEERNWIEEDMDQRLEGDDMENLKHLRNSSSKSGSGENIKDSEELPRNDSNNIERDLMKMSKEVLQLSEGKRIKGEIFIGEQLEMDLKKASYEKDYLINDAVDDKSLPGGFKYNDVENASQKDTNISELLKQHFQGKRASRGNNEGGNQLHTPPLKTGEEDNDSLSAKLNPNLKDSKDEYFERNLTVTPKDSQKLSAEKRGDKENKIEEQLKSELKDDFKNKDVDDIKYGTDKSDHLVSKFIEPSQKEHPTNISEINHPYLQSKGDFEENNDKLKIHEEHKDNKFSFNLSEKNGQNNKDSQDRSTIDADLSIIPKDLKPLSEEKRSNDEQLKIDLKMASSEKDDSKNKESNDKFLLGDLKYKSNDRSDNLFSQFKTTSSKEPNLQYGNNKDSYNSEKHIANISDLQNPLLQSKNNFGKNNEKQKDYDPTLLNTEADVDKDVYKSDVDCIGRDSVSMIKIDDENKTGKKFKMNLKNNDVDEKVLSGDLKYPTNNSELEKPNLQGTKDFGRNKEGSNISVFDPLKSGNIEDTSLKKKLALKGNLNISNRDSEGEIAMPFNSLDRIQTKDTYNIKKAGYDDSNLINSLTNFNEKEPKEEESERTIEDINREKESLGAPNTRSQKKKNFDLLYRKGSSSNKDYCNELEEMNSKKKNNKHNLDDNQISEKWENQGQKILVSSLNTETKEESIARIEKESGKKDSNILSEFPQMREKDFEDNRKYSSENINKEDIEKDSIKIKSMSPQLMSPNVIDEKRGHTRKINDGEDILEQRKPDLVNTPFEELLSKKSSSHLHKNSDNESRSSNALEGQSQRDNLFIITSNSQNASDLVSKKDDNLKKIVPSNIYREKTSIVSSEISLKNELKNKDTPITDFDLSLGISSGPDNDRSNQLNDHNSSKLKGQPLNEKEKKEQHTFEEERRRQKDTHGDYVNSLNPSDNSSKNNTNRTEKKISSEHTSTGTNVKNSERLVSVEESKRKDECSTSKNVCGFKDNLLSETTSVQCVEGDLNDINLSRNVKISPTSENQLHYSPPNVDPGFKRFSDSLSDIKDDDSLLSGNILKKNDEGRLWKETGKENDDGLDRNLKISEQHENKNPREENILEDLNYRKENPNIEIANRSDSDINKKKWNNENEERRKSLSLQPIIDTRGSDLSNLKVKILKDTGNGAHDKLVKNVIELFEEHRMNYNINYAELIKRHLDFRYGLVWHVIIADGEYGFHFSYEEMVMFEYRDLVFAMWRIIE